MINAYKIKYRQITNKANVETKKDLQDIIIARNYHDVEEEFLHQHQNDGSFNIILSIELIEGTVFVSAKAKEII